MVFHFHFCLGTIFCKLFFYSLPFLVTYLFQFLPFPLRIESSSSWTCLTQIIFSMSVKQFNSAWLAVRASFDDLDLRVLWHWDLRLDLWLARGLQIHEGIREEDAIYVRYICKKAFATVPQSVGLWTEGNWYGLNRFGAADRAWNGVVEPWEPLVDPYCSM